MRFRFPLETTAAALLGLAGVGLMRLSPNGPGAIAALILWTAAALARGERGIARWFPRLPLFGSLLAASTLLLRWYSLISLEHAGQLLPAVPAALAIASAASILAGYLSRPADDAAVRRLAPLDFTQAALSIAIACAIACGCGWRMATVLTLAAWALARSAGVLLRSAARRSDLDAIATLAQTLTLVLAASLRSL